MKNLFSASVLGVAALAGCATTATVPAGMKPGHFVTYECESGKRLQARLAADGTSVRIRYEGGYELDNKGNGVYQAEGWKLDTAAAGGFELVHNGKTMLKNCKPA